MARAAKTKPKPAPVAPEPEAPGIELLAAQAERRSIGELTPFARNSRLHSDDQIRQLAEAFKVYGFTVPVLVAEDGTILAGHGRVRAAQLLGMAEVPVVVARGWDEAKVRAYVIWDNRSAELATWDLPALRLELGELQDLGFDLGVVGFTLEQIADMAEPGPKEPPTAPDDFPAFGEGIVTTYCCPKCSYRWSGNPHSGT